MKKIVLLLSFICISFATFADEKTYKNGEVTAYYSDNRAEIVDNNTNTCIVVTIESSKNSLGETIYELACNNRITKGLTKMALQGAIAAAITSASGGAAAPAVKLVSSAIANDLYDRACAYFAD